MSRQVLSNVEIWIGDGSRIESGHIVIRDGLIEAVGEGAYTGDSQAEIVDLGGMAVSPGLIDLMVLGGFEKSILRDDPADIAKQYLRLGVTSCQFCTGTLPWDATVQIARNVASLRIVNDPGQARVIGFYAEGPFMHPKFTGASLADSAIPPNEQNVSRALADLGDSLTAINVSPGIEGAPEAVARFVEAGVVVSMAHSNASADEIEACLSAGTSVLGHVFDNNSGRIGDSGVQQPTLEHVAFTDERVKFIHMICDGSHVHPILVKLVRRCRGDEAICLVTDAVTKAGTPDGPYVWDDGRNFYKEGGVGRTSEGWLCGSALLLPDHFRNYVKFTGSLPHEAIRTVTYNPACSLGMADQLGMIAPGCAADIVGWDKGLQIKRVWRQGVELQDVSEYAEISLDQQAA